MFTRKFRLLLGVVLVGILLIYYRTNNAYGQTTLELVFPFTEEHLPNGTLVKWNIHQGYNTGSHVGYESYAFDLVQKKVFAPPKADWRSKEFDYAKVFKCAACNRPLSGDEKFRKLKNGRKRRHVYYHCTRSFYNHCDQPYTNESILETEIIKFVETNVHKMKISSELEEMIVRFERLRDGVLDQHKVLKATRDLDLAGYAKHIVRNGTRKEKQFFIHGLLTRPKLWNRQLIFTQK